MWLISVFIYTLKQFEALYLHKKVLRLRELFSDVLMQCSVKGRTAQHFLSPAECGIEGTLSCYLIFLIISRSAGNIFSKHV